MREMARRAGVTPAVLRAWELRYGLLSPARSAGGTRLYSEDDLARVQLMLARMADGIPAGEAARSVIAAREARGEADAPDGDPSLPPGATSESELASTRVQLRLALSALQRDRAEMIIDRLLGWVPIDVAIESVILPYLRDVGQRWADGETGIAEEHLATNVLRTRFLALSRNHAPTRSRPILLACPPEERHDLPLVLMMALMSLRGARPVLLGADTPTMAITQAAIAVDASAIVMSSIEPSRFHAVSDELADVAGRWPLMIAGPGATPSLATELGAHQLTDVMSGAVAAVDAASRP